jgi:hypothetical protein
MYQEKRCIRFVDNDREGECTANKDQYNTKPKEVDEIAEVTTPLLKKLDT